GLTPHDAGRQAKLGTKRSDFIFEQSPQRLDQFEPEVARQPADIVVRLDVRRARAAARLDHIGAERALDEELDASARPGRAVAGSDLARRPFEGPDEFPADDLALDLGIRDADQRCREVRPSVENHEIDSRGGYEVPLHLLGLVLAQQAVVNEY